MDRDGKAKPPNHEPEATGMSIPALTNPHKLEEVGLVTAIQAGVWFVSPDLGMGPLTLPRHPKRQDSQDHSTAALSPGVNRGVKEAFNRDALLFLGDPSNNRLLHYDERRLGLAKLCFSEPTSLESIY